MDQAKLNEFLAHFPRSISDEIKEYTIETVLKDSRYMFTKRSRTGQQYGFCTYCKQEMRTENFKHNKFYDCHKCGSKCMAKDHGRGRKYLSDSGYFVWYEKSLTDPNTIVAQGFLVRRDYSDEYREIETKYINTSRYVFTPGEAKMYANYYWQGDDWHLRNTIVSECSNNMANRSCYWSYPNIEKAVQGTPFQYSTWEEHTYYGDDMLRFFDLYAKYPCVEYLTKLNMKLLVRDKLFGRATFSAINWRAKRIDKVLKLNKQEIKEIRDKNLNITFFSLYCYGQAKKEGKPFTLEGSIEASHQLYGDSDVLKQVRKYAKIKDIFNYIKRQEEAVSKMKDREHHWRPTVRFWRDYLETCEKLLMDLSDEMLLFPKDLYKAHNAAVKKLKLVGNKLLDKKIEKRMDQLKSFEFSNDQFFIRPAESSNELNKEGNTLSHCVANYTDRYADGKTIILILRSKKNPDQPLYTLEILKGNIQQIHGKRHKQPTGEVQAFVEQFKKAKLRKKNRKQAVSA